MSKRWNLETARELTRPPECACPFCGRTDALRIVALRNDEHDPLFVRTIFCIPCGYKPNGLCDIGDESIIKEWDKLVGRRRKTKKE
jgi:C4-type Zn-finger protein